MMGRAIVTRCAVVLALSLYGAQTAYAADDAAGRPEASAAGSPEWAVQITPYLWAAGLKGDISPFKRAPTLGVEKSFSDVLSDLNLGGFAHIWGRRDRFVVSGDVMYVDTTDGHASGPLPAFQIPGLGVPIPPGATVDAKVDTKQFIATLQGGYRVFTTPQFTLDALAGARVWRISNDVSVTASHPAIGTRSASHGEKFSWIDPVVGARGFLSLTDNLSLQAQADIGGFGAGADFTWSALATANYTFTDSLSASLGYKALDVDYDQGGHVYDTRLAGPVLGVTYRF